MEQTNISHGEVMALVATGEGIADHDQAFIAQLLSQSESSQAFLVGHAGDATRRGLENLAELLQKQNNMFRDILHQVKDTTAQMFASNEESASSVAQAMSAATEVCSF